MLIKLISVGRQKVTKEVEVKDLDGALREVCKHLMSSDVSMEPRDEDPTFYQVYAGFHDMPR